MSAGDPRTALEAVTWPRLLVSRWPWRSAGYLLTTVPVAFMAAVGLAIPAVPWLVLTTGGHQPGVVVGLILLGAALVVLLGPIIATPLAELERRRLHTVDARPIGPRKREVPHDGLSSRLRAIYKESATWREVGYACLLAGVAPVLSLAALLSAPLAVSYVASPFMVLAQEPGGLPVALPGGQVATVGETVPYLVTGLVMLPVIPYLWTLLAGAHAAVARYLLQGDPGGQLRAELVEVSRSRARLADAFEAERRRIERDLHDGAQQRLVSLTLQLGLARLDLPDESPASRTVADAHDQAKQLMNELRELIHGIQPQVLTDLGLPAALTELTDQSPIPVTLSAELTGRLPSQIENTAYFVTAEALTNIAKHSGATNANVTVRRSGDLLTLEISDDGHGGADAGHGSGLTGLADRIAVTGGRMLLSSPHGGPTLLRAELPCTPNQQTSV